MTDTEENTLVNNQSEEKELSPEQKLLEELASDEYGYDLRNWKEAGITEDEIRKRYETCAQENDYPNISASRYFGFVLPKLKTEFNIPVEKIVEVIMQSRDKNYRKLKGGCAGAVKHGLKMYLMNKTEKNLEYPKRSYEEYVRYCKSLNEQSSPKEYFWDLAKKEFKEKAKWTSMR
jgi:hypothetical protein